MYKKCNQIVISVNLNTAINPYSGQDHITELFNDAYAHILEIHPEYKCE